MRDSVIDAAADAVLTRLALQLGAAKTTAEQIRSNQPTILGYIATLAELESKQLRDRDQSAAASLITLIVAGRCAGESADYEQLVHEFHALRDSKDFLFGQGGAMALEDFEAVANGQVPHALAEWFVRGSDVGSAA
jgi:hypothetical protein